MDPQSLNAYSYGRNNPVLLVDENGEFWHIVIGAGIGVVVAGGIAYYQTGSWDQTWKAAAGGAVAGAVIAAVGPATLAGAMVTGGGATMAGNTLTRALNGEEINAGTLATDAVVGAAGGGLGYGVGKAGSMLIYRIFPRNFNPNVAVKSYGKVLYQGNRNLNPSLEALKNGKLTSRIDPRTGLPSFYQNKESWNLKNFNKNYYTEHELVDGMSIPGKTSPERLLVGQKGEIYYSPDHYASQPIRVQ